MKAKLSELLAKDKKRRVKSEDADSSNSSSSSILSSSSSGGSYSNAGQYYITSSMALTTFFGPGSALFSPSTFINENFTDYVFGEKDVLPADVAMRRIEKYKKRHPEEFTEPLEKMYEKAYPKKKAGIFRLFKKEAK